MLRACSLLFILALVMTLTACRQAVKPEPTFTMTLKPAALTVRVTETGRMDLTINRSGGFADPVTVSLAGDVTGLEAEPVAIAGNEGSLHIRVTDAAEIGTSFVTVKAEGGGITRIEPLTLHVENAVARAIQVVREGDGGSRQVRQGFGIVSLVITGDNLERVTGVRIGDLEFETVERTAARLVLAAAVPHGASPGIKDLTLSAAGGDTVFPAALEVTPVTAGPFGNDANGSGTTEQPVRTLTRALSLAGTGDTVLLLDGTYSAAAGESWPPHVDAVSFPNVPHAVHVTGQSADGVILDGDLARAGLVFAGDGGAANLVIRGFQAGLLASEGEVDLIRIRAEGNAIGLAAIGGLATVMDSEFMNNAVSGIAAIFEAALELRGGSAHHNGGDGVTLLSGATVLHATGFASHHNRHGLNAAGSATVTLEESSLHDNQEHGLMIQGDATALVEGGEFYGNAQGGIWSEGKSLKLRGVTARDNGEFGVYVAGTPERIDLGSFFEPGENDLYGNGPNGNSGHLLDARPPRPTIEAPIIFTVSATHIGGVLPEPDIYVGLHLDDLGFSVLGVNNVIQIY